MPVCSSFIWRSWFSFFYMRLTSTWVLPSCSRLSGLPVLLLYLLSHFPWFQYGKGSIVCLFHIFSAEASLMLFQTLLLIAVLVWVFWFVFWRWLLSYLLHTWSSYWWFLFFLGALLYPSGSNTLCSIPPYFFLYSISSLCSSNRSEYNWLLLFYPLILFYL